MKVIILIALATLIGNGVVAQATPLHTEAGIIGVKEVQVKQLNKLADTVSEPTSSGKFKQVAVAPSTGDCEAYLRQAGVQDLVNARILIGKENRACDAQRYNMQGSDACGIAQELPCGKSGCGIPPNANGACQVKWMDSYVKARYGSWAGAVAFHNTHNWY